MLDPDFQRFWSSFRNTDEWPPEATKAYAGPASALYLPSTFWIDHFLIHDDNFGPHYALSTRALEINVDVKATHVIGIVPVKPAATAPYAEALAASLLAPILVGLSGAGGNRWLHHMRGQLDQLILRPILISRDVLRLIPYCR